MCIRVLFLTKNIGDFEINEYCISCFSDVARFSLIITTSYLTYFHSYFQMLS